ncbi:MAG TPA: RluA family pseudouridine synthase [Polyangiales bacterium]|nr:RluA family pseudouridine synthase [Polyangiales bacterium]
MDRGELQMVGHEPPPIELDVKPEEAGERLDIVLSRRGLGLSRAAVQHLIAADRVSLDGRPARASLRVKAGENVIVCPLPPPPSTAEPEDLPVEVLHEDPQILVIVKAAGMVVHPAPGHGSGTLVNALRFRQSVRELEEDETERPGIVHRLDKDTSGVMVVAKTVAARAGLIEQFQAHNLERAYRAIALGVVPPQQTFETTHARHPVDRKRFTGRLARGKRAVTHVRLLEQLEGASYVECKLETGRTHQIRMHLSEAGHPLLADKLYGRATRDARILAAAEAIGRQALHAQVLGFEHPTTAQRMRFEAPAPADFLAALELLRTRSA